MNNTLNTKREIILAVKKILKKRMKKLAQGESFKTTCKRYADFYIAPLIPSPQSKYHDTIKNLHQRLTTL